MKRVTLAAALLLATVSSSSWAQSSVDHEAHHPDQKSPTAAQPSPPSGQPGMMGDNMPMANMMRMMGRQGPGSGCPGMSGMATIDHVEGRIAFLRTELKITDAETSTWNSFADALRANAKSLAEVRASMMQQQGVAQQNLVDRLTLQEKWLAARLEGTRAMKSALTNLVGTLSDEQKKAADELLAPHMGMGAMACAMQSGQMGAARMQAGMMTQGQGR